MAARYTLDGFVITQREPTGAPHAGADSGVCLSMRPRRESWPGGRLGRLSSLAAREAVIARPPP